MSGRWFIRLITGYGKVIDYRTLPFGADAADEFLAACLAEMLATACTDGVMELELRRAWDESPAGAAAQAVMGDLAGTMHDAGSCMLGLLWHLRGSDFAGYADRMRMLISGVRAAMAADGQ